jgi:hypothetical protein
LSAGLFHSLWDIGLDRQQPSIHEMLTDILEVVAVAEGSKPAHLAGQGRAAAWRADAFARAAGTAGLQVLRTAPLGADPGRRWAGPAAEFPRMVAALRRRAGRLPPAAEVTSVCWIYRDPRLPEVIGRLVGGEAGLACEVLGYPPCCTAFDGRGETDFLRALMRLYEDQHGLKGEAAVAQALEAGLEVRPHPCASEELEPVWRTRLVFPYLGYTACPDCLERPAESPSAGRNRSARALAFRLEEGFACALWRSARAEAALATRGHFQALDPSAQEACPCGSGLRFADCCARRPSLSPSFR